MANLNRQCRRYQYFWVICSIRKYAFIIFFSYWVNVRDGTFFGTTVDKPNGWFHSVLNFFGPDEGLGIYHNGMHVRNITGKRNGQHKPNTIGNIVLGRVWADSDAGYSSIDVDELFFH